MTLKTKAFGDIITFTRASGGGRFNSSGAYEWLGNDVPRLDYDPVTGECRGLLIEEQRTNLLVRSSVEGVVIGTPGTLPTGWRYAQVPGGCSVNIVGSGSVNGLNYVDIRLSGTTTNNNALLIEFGSAAVAAGQYCLSCYAAVIAGSALAYGFNGGGGVGATFGPKPLTANLARYNTSWTLTAGTLYPWLHLTPGGVGLAIDVTVRLAAPQLEAGAFPTSYIPTVDSQVTRSADVASVNTLSPWYNATEGTLFVDVGRFNGSSARAVTLNDGTAQNQIWIRPSSGDSFAGYKSGAFHWQVTIPGGGGGRYAGAYKLNDIAVSRNGSAVITDTSAEIPVVSKMRIGASWDGAVPLNGHIQRIEYYPRRLSNTELQEITA